MTFQFFLVFYELINVRKRWETQSRCKAHKSVRKSKLKAFRLALSPALRLFFCPPLSPFHYPPRPLAFHSSEPPNATYHHIPLWFLTPVWCMLFFSLAGPGCTQTAYQSLQSCLPCSVQTITSDWGLIQRDVSCECMQKVLKSAWMGIWTWYGS